MAKMNILTLMVILGVGALALGVFKLPTGSVLSAIPAAQTTGICPTTGTTDLGLAAFESVAQPNGVNRQVGTGSGAIELYYTSDATGPSTTVTGSATTFTSTSTDPNCGTKGVRILLRAPNGTYYNGSYNLDVQQVAFQQVPLKVDAIATMQLTMDGSAFTGNATPVQIAFGSGESISSLVLKVRANTAQGVLRGPLLVCFNMTSNMDDPANNYVIGGKRESTDGCGTGFEFAYSAPINRIEDFATASIPLRISADTGVNPDAADNLSITVVDWATYIVNGQAKEGWRDNNQNTIGATDTAFAVNPT